MFKKILKVSLCITLLMNLFIKQEIKIRAEDNITIKTVSTGFDKESWSEGFWDFNENHAGYATFKYIAFDSTFETNLQANTKYSFTLIYNFENLNIINFKGVRFRDKNYSDTYKLINKTDFSFTYNDNQLIVTGTIYEAKEIRSIAPIFEVSLSVQPKNMKLIEGYASIYVEPIATPILEINDSIVTMNRIENATSYDLYRNGEYLTTFQDQGIEQYVLDLKELNVLQNGYNEFYVIAKNDSVESMNSNTISYYYIPDLNYNGKVYQSFYMDDRHLYVGSNFDIELYKNYSIKINDKSYNLQALAGYTVDGNLYTYLGNNTLVSSNNPIDTGENFIIYNTGNFGCIVTNEFIENLEINEIIEDSSGGMGSGDPEYEYDHNYPAHQLGNVVQYQLQSALGEILTSQMGTFDFSFIGDFTNDLDCIDSYVIAIPIYRVAKGENLKLDFSIWYQGINPNNYQMSFIFHDKDMVTSVEYPIIINPDNTTLIYTEEDQYSINYGNHSINNDSEIDWYYVGIKIKATEGTDYKQFGVGVSEFEYSINEYDGGIGGGSNPELNDHDFSEDKIGKVVQFFLTSYYGGIMESDFISIDEDYKGLFPAETDCIDDYRFIIPVNPIVPGNGIEFDYSVWYEGIDKDNYILRFVAYGKGMKSVTYLNLSKYDEDINLNYRETDKYTINTGNNFIVGNDSDFTWYYVGLEIISTEDTNHQGYGIGVLNFNYGVIDEEGNLIVPDNGENPEDDTDQESLLQSIINLPSKIANSLSNMFGGITNGIDNMKTVLSNAINNLGSTIVDGIGGLFIPEEGFFEEYFDDLYSFFETKLGVLILPFDIFSLIFKTVENLGEGDGYIHVPEFIYMDYPLIPETHYNLKEAAEELGFVYDLYLMATDVIIILMTLNFANKKFDEITRK